MNRQFRSVPILLAWSWQSLFAVDVSWNKMPGLGLDIAGNEAGAAWVIGVERLSNSGFGIYTFVNGSWNAKAGVARRITVDPSGRPWAVNEDGKIFRFDLNSNSWQMLPGLGSDIAA